MNADADVTDDEAEAMMARLTDSQVVFLYHDDRCRQSVRLQAWTQTETLRRVLVRAGVTA